MIVQQSGGDCLAVAELLFAAAVDLIEPAFGAPEADSRSITKNI